MIYRREIDGLRAVAVLSVVFFHAGFPVFSGGYVGVDVFFVISGFLITSIILREMDASTYSLAGFYERRARRILPALMLVVLVSIPFAWLWMMPAQLENFSESIAATFAFVSNVYFREQVDYFAPAAELQPLLHTWSLAVEEQFYLFMPFLLLLYRRFGAQRLLWVVASLAILSFLVAQRGTIRHPEENFFELKSRIWELMLGSVLAIIQLRNGLAFVPEKIAGAMSLCGLFAIALAVTVFDNETPMPGLWALLPTLGAVVFIAFANSHNLAGRLLGARLPVAIGLVSYSVYLWHFPVFALARIRFDYPSDEVWPPVLLVALVLLLSWASYRWIEQPFRRARISRGRVFLWVGGSMTVMLLVALLGVKAQGFPDRLTGEQTARLALIAEAEVERMIDDGQCVFHSDQLDETLLKRFSGCAGRGYKAAIVLGDSHGRDMFNAIAQNTRRQFVVGLARHNCRPQNKKPECEYDKIQSFIVSHAHQIDIVIYDQAGQHFLRHETTLPIKMDELATLQDYLSGLSRHVRTVWFGPQAEPNVDLRNMNILFRNISATDALSENKLIAEVDALLIQSNHEQGVNYISLLPVLRYVFEQDFFVDGRYTYGDKHHWSTWGEQYFGKRLLENTVLKSIIHGVDEESDR